MPTTDQATDRRDEIPEDLEDWMIPDDDQDLAPVALPDDDGARRARQSGTRLVEFSARTSAWTCMYRPEDDGDLADDTTFHARRMAVLMNSRSERTEYDAPPGAGRLGYYNATMREAQGRSRLQFATVANVGLDPVAVILLEHGRLNRGELGAVFLSRVAMTLGVPVALLEAFRDGTADAPVADRATTVTFTEKIAAWVRQALAAVLPDTTQLALAMGEPATSTVGEGRVEYAIDTHPIGRAVPMPVAIIHDTAGARFELVPALVPEAHPLPGVCGVEVTVRDDAGHPVSGRRIRLAILGIPGFEDSEPTATTGPDGVARFSRVSVSNVLESLDFLEAGTNSGRAGPFTLLDA